MKIPALDHPQRYRGLYLFDFGSWTAVGYTAEEIAILLESEPYREGKVYKIVRAGPDGSLELRGVAPTRFQVESGMFFNRSDLSAARNDFHQLEEIARRTAPPCRAYVHLADRGVHEGVSRYVTAVIYPAEYEDEMSRWLLEAAFAGGDTAEGGPSHVSNYYQEPNEIIARVQLHAAGAIPARSPDEVLGSVRQAVQR